jgi:hypothetical protein
MIRASLLYSATRILYADFYTGLNFAKIENFAPFDGEIFILANSSIILSASGGNTTVFYSKHVKKSPQNLGTVFPEGTGKLWILQQSDARLEAT